MDKKAMITATGRRKTSVARVRLVRGRARSWSTSASSPATSRARRCAACSASFEVTETTGRFDVHARVEGGGLTGQAGAFSLGSPARCWRAIRAQAGAGQGGPAHPRCAHG